MLTKDVYESLPNEAKPAFVQDGDQFVPVKDAKLKQSINELDQKYKETASKLSEYEKMILARKEEEERQSYEKHKKDGNISEIEKRLQQQLDDQKRIAGETAQQYEERLSKIAETAKKGKRGEIVADLSSEVLDKFKPAFKRLAAELVDYDPVTGEEIYFNEDGSASSAKTRAEFLREVIAKSETFTSMLKAPPPPTSGGGFAQGAQQSGRTSFGAGKLDGSKEQRAAYFADKFKIK